MAGYICACSLPGFGDWKQWSLMQLRKWKKSEFKQPQPSVSEHSIPSENWTMLLCRLSGKKLRNVLIYIDDIEIIFCSYQPESIGFPTVDNQKTKRRIGEPRNHL